MVGAAQRVGTRTGVVEVRAGAAGEDVVAGPAEQLVRAEAGDQLVGPPRPPRVTGTRFASPAAAVSANETAVPSSSVSDETEAVAAKAAGAPVSAMASASAATPIRTCAT